MSWIPIGPAGGLERPEYHAAVKHPLWRLLGVLGFGALASQVGHLLVYEVQFGSGAATIESQGAHAYFPMFAKTSIGLAVAALMAGLLIVGASRLASGRPVRATSSPPLRQLLSTLFTVQVAVFIAQETIEAVISGTQVPHLVALFFLGTMGQLPVAAAAALAIKWLAARLELAVVALRVELAQVAAIALAEIAPLPRLRPAVQAALAEASPASFVKRGPPQSLRR